MVSLVLYASCVDLEEPWNKASRGDAAGAPNDVALSDEPGGGGLGGAVGGAGGEATGGSDLDGGFDAEDLGTGGVGGTGTDGGEGDAICDADGSDDSGAGGSGSLDGSDERDCCEQDAVDAAQTDSEDAAERFDGRTGAEARVAHDLGDDSDKADGNAGGVSGTGGSSVATGGVTGTGGSSVATGGVSGTGGVTGTGGGGAGTGGITGTGGDTRGPNLALDATWWGDGVSPNRTGNYPRIFVSSVQSTSANTAAGLCDGAPSTFWVSTGVAATPTTFPQWVGIEFASEVTITAVVLSGRMNDDRAYNPSDYVIQTSNDGLTWDDQATVAPPTSYPITQRPVTSPIATVLPSPVRAKWVRLFITGAFYVIGGQQQPTVPNVQIAELEIY